jgi:transporter family-2 protein
MNGSIGLMMIAAIGGCAVALQGQFMGLLDKGVGTSAGLFINYGSGALIAGIVLLMLQGGNLKAWNAMPWYTLTAGILGVLIVAAIGYSVPRLGLSVTFTIVVAAQFIMAMLLDHFGWLGASMRPLAPLRLAGAGALILGVWLTARA